MGISKEPIKMIKIEYICDKCASGFLRHKYTNGVIIDSDTEHVHQCENCEQIYVSNTIFPKVVPEGCVLQKSIIVKKKES